MIMMELLQSNPIILVFICDSIGLKIIYSRQINWLTKLDSHLDFTFVYWIWELKKPMKNKLVNGFRFPFSYIFLTTYLQSSPKRS